MGCAAAFAEWTRIGMLLIKAAEYQHVFAEPSQRLHDRSHLETGAFGSRTPTCCNNPVGSVNNTHPNHWLRCLVRWACQGRYHAVEQGKRNGGAQTLQKSSAR